MDVILKVLEGAKSGTKIAVKKDEFLVGRSQQCHLCAGSSSVSRRHCAITRKDATVSIKDLGSRNGTLVNDTKISEEVELASGDEIGIGTLKLLVTITHGITNLKRPKVKTVADAVERTVAGSDSSVHEEDITQWLLDAPGPPSSPKSPGPTAASNQAASETQTIRMDDTNAVQLRDKIEQQDSEKQDHSASSSAKASDGGSSVSGDSSIGGGSTVGSTTVGSTSGVGQHEDSSSAKPGTATSAEEIAKESKQDSKKKPPGKLPPRPNEPGSKDSREAAMQALRNWNRRR